MSVHDAPSRPLLLELALHAWHGARLVALWSWPHLCTLGRAVLAVLEVLVVIARVLASEALRRRSAIVAVVTRIAWWMALVLLFVAGRAVFDLREPLDPNALTIQLVGGFSLSAFVLSVAAERRLRCAAWCLALAHGALGLLCLGLAT